MQQSSSKPVDPLAVGYLMGQGLSPGEVTSWTTGACSHPVKADSCYAMLPWGPTPKPVDPLAVGYLIGRGLTPGEVRAWTTGSCSHPVKAASCFAMFRSPPTDKYSPAAQAGPKPEGVTAQQWQAELARGDALNQRYGLGAYAASAHTSAATTPAPVRVVNVAADGFDWGAAAIGAGVAFGLALVSAGALMAVRKRRTLAHA